MVGVDDDVCPPAQAKLLFDGLERLEDEKKSLVIIEFEDIKNKDGPKMGHTQWTNEWSVGLLNQVAGAVENGASNLTALTFALASIAALSLY